MEDDATPHKRCRRSASGVQQKITRLITQAEGLQVRLCNIGETPHLVSFVSKTTGKTYAVCIAAHPTPAPNGAHCDCKNGASAALLCEHTLFVLLKGFLVPREAALLQKGTLNDDDIRRLFGEDNAGLREAHERLSRLAMQPLPGTYRKWDPKKVYVIRISKT